MRALLETHILMALRSSITKAKHWFFLLVSKKYSALFKNGCLRQQPAIDLYQLVCGHTMRSHGWAYPLHHYPIKIARWARAADMRSERWRTGSSWRFWQCRRH